jgi:hypothetical protein
MALQSAADLLQKDGCSQAKQLKSFFFWQNIKTLSLSRKAVAERTNDIAGDLRDQ